jgi:MoaA/NifB/PqqE/SkfB family radical SAM enzyme
MCNPVTSSSWYSDGYELEKANLTSSSWYADDQSDRVASTTFNEYTKTFETVRNSFNRDNTEFWDTLEEWIKNLVFIDIYGGEPFLSPAMFELLEHGASIGCAKDIELNIHTNASIFNTRYIEILKQYKKVSFRVSIDSHTPEHLEYIRHKADYNQVINNTINFKKILSQSPNVNIGITNTITPLNVFYVDQTNKWLADTLELPVGTNIVHTPEYDIRHLPIPVKRYLIENTQNTQVTNFLQQTISGCDIEWPKFCKATDRLDQLRKQSFAKTFPDWWAMLEPYWVKSESICN